MTCSPAASEAKRIGLPKTDRTLNCVSSRPVRAAACSVRTWTPSSVASVASGIVCDASPARRARPEHERRCAWAGGGGRCPTCEACSREPREFSQLLLRHMRIPPKRSQRVHAHTLPFARQLTANGAKRCPETLHDRPVRAVSEGNSRLRGPMRAHRQRPAHLVLLGEWRVLRCLLDRC